MCLPTGPAEAQRVWCLDCTWFSWKPRGTPPFVGGPGPHVCHVGVFWASIQPGKSHIDCALQINPGHAKLDCLTQLSRSNFHPQRTRLLKCGKGEKGEIHETGSAKTVRRVCPFRSSKGNQKEPAVGGSTLKKDRNTPTWVETHPHGSMNPVPRLWRVRRIPKACSRLQQQPPAPERIQEDSKRE